MDSTPKPERLLRGGFKGLDGAFGGAADFGEKELRHGEAKAEIGNRQADKKPKAAGDDRDKAWRPADHSQNPARYAADDCTSDGCADEAQREEDDPRFQVIDSVHIRCCHTVYRYRLSNAGP